MKKLLIFMCLAVCLSLFASCTAHTDDNPNISGNTPAVDTSVPLDAAPPSFGASKVPLLSDGSIPEEPDFVREQFHVEVYEDDKMGVVAQYISVTGISDEKVQNTLNENIKDFFLWQWLYSAPDAERYWLNSHGTASYHVVGGRYLSVVQLVDLYSDEPPSDGNYEPTARRISAQIFDLTTGEPDGELVFGGAAYTMANAADKFSQVYPDADDAAAKAKFHDFMQSNEVVYKYYLTEATLACFLENDNGDDYYIFEAPYALIPEMLSKSLADAIEGEN